MPGPGTTSLPEWTRSRGKSFDGEEGDLVDRDVNDLGKAYGDDVKGVRGSAKIIALVCEPKIFDKVRHRTQGGKRQDLKHGNG